MGVMEQLNAQTVMGLPVVNLLTDTVMLGMLTGLFAMVAAVLSKVLYQV